MKIVNMRKELDINQIGLYRAPNEYQYLNYNDRLEGVITDTIVIHYTVGDFRSSYLTLTAPRGVSAHYLIDRDGRIDNLVPDDKRAWHAGKSYWHEDNVNDFSIGIELVNSGSGQSIDLNGKLSWEQIDLFPQAQMVSLVALIDYIKSNNPNIKNQNIVGHSDIALGRKIDPGIAFNWKYLADNGHGLYSDDKHDCPTVLYKFGDSCEGIKSIQAKLSKYGYNTSVTGEFDEDTQNVVRAFNMHFHNDTTFDYEIWDSVSDMRLDALLECQQI